MAYQSVWNKMGPKKGILKTLPQHGKRPKSILADAARKARLPGKRISKSGKEYWETRPNRSDRKPNANPAL